ncbi:putative ribonuclease H-like domain-containing protein [Tanacetum coccineum]
MLTMRVKRFHKEKQKECNLNGKETVGFDRTKVECYNCHRRGHFAREYRAPRNQGNKNRYNPRRNAPVDTSTTNALVVQDGIGGYDWSFQAEDGITNFALMAYTSLKVIKLDESVFKSAVRKTTTSVPETETSISKTSKDIVEKPKTVRPSAPIIKEWDTNSDNDTATSISIARPVNTATPKPKVNDALPTTYSYFKAHSPLRRAINQKSAAKANNFNEKVNTGRVNNVTTAGPKAVVRNVIDHNSKDNGSYMLKRFDYVDLQGGSRKGGKITGKGKIRTGKLDFEDVYFVKELKFNLFSVSQMCDKKSSVLFTKTECLVLSPNFKLLDESQVLLKVPRHDNLYSFDLKNVVPSGGLICLFEKATIDESNLWHRRLGHINFKTMNKLVRGNLVRGLSSKLFENDHTCVACQKGKQHKASCKTKLVSFINQPLQMLHMDLFGTTSVRSINHKTCCLIVTDDFSRFSWVFFLATKDETSGILKTFITGIKNQINHKVKIIRCDNGTEFKNNNMNQFCGMKGIKKEFSVARTP